MSRTLVDQARAGVLEFPFLFYGRRPADWVDGAGMGHVYEVRFREPLATDRRSWVALVFETALHDTVVSPPDAGHPFHWSGHWALLCVGERRIWGQAFDHDRFFEDMTKTFLALHQIAGIAEVVMGNARRRGDSRWDRWSHAQQRRPSSHPPFPAYRRVYGLDDADYLEDRATEGACGDIDAAFEAARIRVRADLDALHDPPMDTEVRQRTTLP
jgi:hypothetical protein